MEMVRVGENHLRPHGAQILRVEGLDRGQGANSHKRRSLDHAVRRVKDARARDALRGIDGKSK